MGPQDVKPEGYDTTQQLEAIIAREARHYVKQWKRGLLTTRDLAHHLLDIDDRVYSQYPVLLAEAIAARGLEPNPYHYTSSASVLSPEEAEAFAEIIEQPQSQQSRADLTREIGYYETGCED